MHISLGLIESIPGQEVVQHRGRQTTDRLQSPVVVDHSDLRAGDVCDQDPDDNEQLVRLDGSASSQLCLDLVEALNGDVGVLRYLLPLLCLNLDRWTSIC